MTRNLAAALTMTIIGTATAGVIDVPGDYPHIQDAIAASFAGDEIIVQPGTYVEQLDLSGKTITLRSSGGPEVTILRAPAGQPVVICPLRSDGVIEGFTITGGTALQGGGMTISNARPVIRDCIFTANSAALCGGALFVHADDDPTEIPTAPLLEMCRFFGNTAPHGGAIFVSDADLHLVGCTFESNDAALGGAIFAQVEFDKDGCPIEARPFMTDTVFRENFADRGGAVYLLRLCTTMTSCDFIGNSASAGGAIFADASVASSMISRCWFEENMAEQGGAVRAEGGWLDFRMGTFTANTAVHSGGAVSVTDSQLSIGQTVFVSNWADHTGGGLDALRSHGVIEDSEFLANDAGGGGGASIRGEDRGPWIIKSVLFKQNTALEDAGGLVMESSGDGSMLFDCVFTGNEAVEHGGGLCVLAEAPIMAWLLFEDNRAEFGGGLHALQTVAHLVDSRFARNHAWMRGGGIFSAYGSELTIISSSFDRNVADARGGGIYNGNTASLVLRDSTLDRNEANRGAGLYNAGAGPAAIEAGSFTRNVAAMEGGGVYSPTELTSVRDSLFCANLPQHVFDVFTDEGGNDMRDACPEPCPADLNGNGVVEVDDLIRVVAAWASDELDGGDIDEDGDVDVDDLMILLTAWGMCE